MDSLDHLGRSTQAHHPHHRHHDQRRHHHDALDEVGVGHGQEATDQGVDHRDRGDEHHAQAVVHAEGVLKEHPAGHHAGGDVEGEVDQDDDSAGPAQQVAVVVQAVVEEARDGDGVPGHLGVGAQTRGHVSPVQPGPHCQSDGDPGLHQAGGVQRAWQSHEEPSRHV